MLIDTSMALQVLEKRMEISVLLEMKMDFLIKYYCLILSCLIELVKSICHQVGVSTVK